MVGATTLLPNHLGLGNPGIPDVEPLVVQHEVLYLSMCKLVKNEAHRDNEKNDPRNQSPFC